MMGAATTADAAEGCVDVPSGSTPVVLVHGWNSDNSVWSQMAAMLRTMPGVMPDDSFSYGPAQTQWVTDPRISTALAERVDCLAGKASGGKVVVIAHSMGGLAIRCAANVGCSHGPDISNKLGTVITLGTPNEGSFLALNKYGAGAGGVFAKAMSLNCTLYPHVPAIATAAKEICGILKAVPDPAAKAFAPGSSELAALPKFPSTIPVSGIAGKVSLITDLFTHSFPLAGNAGDLVVSEQSAHAAAQTVNGIGGKETVDCGTTGLPVASFWTPPQDCWHSTETNSPLFLSKVRGTLQKYLDLPVGEPGSLLLATRGVQATITQRFVEADGISIAQGIVTPADAAAYCRWLQDYDPSTLVNQTKCRADTLAAERGHVFTVRANCTQGLLQPAENARNVPAQNSGEARSDYWWKLLVSDMEEYPNPDDPEFSLRGPLWENTTTGARADGTTAGGGSIMLAQYEAACGH